MIINVILKHQQLSFINLEQSFFSKITSRIIRNKHTNVKEILNTADYPRQ
jgi:hypothetical protein